MKKNLDQNLCYVFSPKTADIAVSEWTDKKIKDNPQNKESINIFTVALPWFLEHIQQDASIYMFTQEDFHEKINTWKKIQIKSYPNQKERIDETCDLIILFLESEIVNQHKMRIEA